MTVSTLFATSTSKELLEWQVFFVVEQEDAEAEKEKERMTTMAASVMGGFQEYAARNNQ
jgi:hypothetical protein